MKFSLVTLFCVFALASFNAAASQDYVCDNNGNKRIVSIVYQNEEAPVPCEVRYDKGEGVQTLWTAQSESGYCEARVTEFIEKQESWGWNCNKFEAPVVSDVVDESDVPQQQALENDEQHVTQDTLQEDLHTSLY